MARRQVEAGVEGGNMNDVQRARLRRRRQAADWDDDRMARRYSEYFSATAQLRLLADSWPAPRDQVALAFMDFAVRAALDAAGRSSTAEDVASVRAFRDVIVSAGPKLLRLRTRSGASSASTTSDTHRESTSDVARRRAIATRYVVQRDLAHFVDEQCRADPMVAFFAIVGVGVEMLIDQAAGRPTLVPSINQALAGAVGELDAALAAGRRH
jgi:hypothetical protein